MDSPRIRGDGSEDFEPAAATRSTRSVPGIGDGVSRLQRSEMACSHRLAQFLRCFTSLTTRFIDGGLGHRHIDDLTPDDLTPLEAIHASTPLILTWLLLRCRNRSKWKKPCRFYPAGPSII
jgi:hypothetical protein